MSTADNSQNPRRFDRFHHLDEVDFYDDSPGDTTRRPLRASLLPFARQMRELLERSEQQLHDQHPEGPSTSDAP